MQTLKAWKAFPAISRSRSESAPAPSSKTGVPDAALALKIALSSFSLWQQVDEPVIFGGKLCFNGPL